MLKKIRFWFYRLWIVDCVGCGSLVVHPRGLCLVCEYKILELYLNPVHQPEKLEKSELHFRYLLRWVPGASDILSRYVYLLKSSWAEPLWHEIARYFISQKSVSKKTIFVPIPSQKKRCHSQYFAQALAEQSGGTVMTLLKIDDSDEIEQKAKSREQRHKIRFSLNEEFTEQINQMQGLYLSLIIVDDVITTGASFEAAYNVLKTAKLCPKDIELWTAFRREPLGVDLE